jgi:DNA-binding NtrC family response regulator
MSRKRGAAAKGDARVSVEPLSKSLIDASKTIPQGQTDGSLTEQALSILVIDDDPAMRESLALFLEASGWTVETLPRAESLMKALAQFPADVVLTDLKMPGVDGMQVVEQLRGVDAPPVVVMSGHGDIPLAVGALQKGAVDFVQKPFNPNALLATLSKVAEQHQLSRSMQSARSRLTSFSGLDKIYIGESPAAAALRAAVSDMADVSASVLLLGETGTGKELIAHALHDLGPDPTTPFVVINCAMLPSENLAGYLETLDGITMPLADRVGSGTLFLDEVGACPPNVQPQLLRLLEVEPGGSPGFSGRIISASNAPLEDMVARGEFRRDLLFRLNTFVLSLPSLRGRPTDIAMLFTHFCEGFAQVYGVTAPALTPEDTAALLAHDWPGNVRELRSIAERHVLATRRGEVAVSLAMGAADPADLPSTLRHAVAAFERDMISRALIAHKGQMDVVAESLGIGRRTLNEKIVKLGLDKSAIL